MTVASTIAELKEAIGIRTGSVGFVPTMGALHAGHARLLDVAREENDVVVASIFVNPLQFDQSGDLANYPRDMGKDLDFCREHKVDVVFTPSADELYPRPQLAFVEVPALSKHLCGAFRPGHFRGVCTVVLKLFSIAGPKRAYFGEKDAQQLAIIRRMTDDLNLSVRIVPVSTVREPDGLALSSRNRYLTAAEREQAPRLYQALRAVIRRLDSGERNPGTLRREAEDILSGIRVEYFDFVDPETLEPILLIDNSVLVAGAIWLGSTRLIDNMTWKI